MAVSYATYERVALEDDAVWELVCGRLREKPLMTQEHNTVGTLLMTQLVRQLDEGRFQVRVNAPSLKISSGTYFVPDVAVVPVDVLATIAPAPGLETYEAPLPFVAEVWSPSTGEYDVETKFAEYRLRKDREIWRIHPRERTVTAWRLQHEGSYSEAVYQAGMVAIESLPGVSIDLARLFR
jgi:Uma2 family endonuclease